MSSKNFSNVTKLIWSITDLLRWRFRQSQYGRIILPFILLRRLECALEPTKEKVLENYQQVKDHELPEESLIEILRLTSGLPFYNLSPMVLSKLGYTDTANNLNNYIQNFSSNVREIFTHFQFEESIASLQDANLLHKMIEKFTHIDLTLLAISDYQMGLIFDEFIRYFAENSNEATEGHFTPKDIVELVTTLVITENDSLQLKTNKFSEIYDPAVGTGGFLSAGLETIRTMSADSLKITTFGQELNPEYCAVCKATMLIKGQKAENIKLGNTLTNDQLPNINFDYMLSNPSFAFNWKNDEDIIRTEHIRQSFNGRFGPGLPRVSDGSLLFLLHMISKMKATQEGGSRIGIILKASSLYVGSAGSGESEIRRYILENDLLEAIVALPSDIFYNTGIATYIWILSNNKPAERKNKVILINATNLYMPTRKFLGSKRKYITQDNISTILSTYKKFQPTDIAKIFNTKDFGYKQIIIQRPLKLAIYPRDELRIDRMLADEKGWAKVIHPKDLLAALLKLDNEYLNREQFRKELIKYYNYSNTELRLLEKYLSEPNPKAESCQSNDKIESDPNLRDFENVPLNESVEEYFTKKVQPHITDAWIETTKTDQKDKLSGVVGYSIDPKYFFDIENIQEGKELKYYSSIKIVTKDKPWDVCYSFFRNKFFKLNEIDKEDLVDHYKYIFFKISSKEINSSFLIFTLESKINEILKLSSKYSNIKYINRQQLLRIKLNFPKILEQDLFIEGRSLLKRIASDADEKYKNFIDLSEKNDLYLIKYKDELQTTDFLINRLPYFLSELTYRANNVIDKERFEILLKYAECMSIFFVAILIPKCCTFTNEEMQKVATFGTWTKFMSDILKKGLTCPIVSYLENIYDELINIQKLRNKTIGHGTVPTPQEIQNRLDNIERSLTIINDKLLEMFSNYSLIKPINSCWDGEFYEYEVTVFSGLAGYPFSTKQMKFKTPLLKDKLYFVSDNCEEIYKLHDIIILNEIVENSQILGFYFYSKFIKIDERNNGSEQYEFICHQQVPLQIKKMDIELNCFIF